MKKIVMMVAVAVMATGIARAGEEAGKGEGQGKGPHKARGEWFAKADTDKDGKLSPAEFKAVCVKGDADAKFQAADTDKDGFLTPAELKAAKQQHGGKKHEKGEKGKECPLTPADKPAEAPAK